MLSQPSLCRACCLRSTECYRSFTKTASRRPNLHPHRAWQDTTSTSRANHFSTPVKVTNHAMATILCRIMSPVKALLEVQGERKKSWGSRASDHARRNGQPSRPLQHTWSDISISEVISFPPGAREPGAALRKSTHSGCAARGLRQAGEQLRRGGVAAEGAVRVAYVEPRAIGDSELRSSCCMLWARWWRGRE